ncbi:MAG: PQQ-like beta-propeller repeat protein [Planctomycetes bacterium]|nr:PQQ-like beta-propeller repeat protein [Planctomycetota bacterium]
MSLLLALGLGGASFADDWPAWRGAAGQGQCGEKNLPMKWSPTENVRWKVALPADGSSTPAVWGDQIFVTQANDKTIWPPQGGNGGVAKARKRSLLCFARADGKLLWQSDVIYDEEESTHPTNPFCSASPATDGERVVVSFGSAGLHCYDFSGKELWKVNLGKLEHIWGNASSPVIHGDLVILWCGPGDRQFLLAVNKKTGAKVWEHAEPGGDSKKFVGTWSTPVIVKAENREQLLLGVPNKLKSFDPKTGKELWSCDGLTSLVYTSPLYADGIAVAMSGYGGAALAVKLGGGGDITKNRLWQHPKNSQRIGTGVIVGEHLYMVEEDGRPHCFELKTGQEVWQSQYDKRTTGGAWGSMVHADGKLYITDRGGTTTIFAATPKFEILGTNRLGEHTDASIAVSNGDLFIRTYKSLWCISEKK